MRRQCTVLSLLLVLASAGCGIQETLIVELEDSGCSRGSRSNRRSISRWQSSYGVLTSYSWLPQFLVPVLSLHVEAQLALNCRRLIEDACRQERPKNRTRGTCYLASQQAADEFQPGEQLELTIELTQGRTLHSATTIPGEFTLTGIEDGSRCLLPP